MITLFFNVFFLIQICKCQELTTKFVEFNKWSAFSDVATLECSNVDSYIEQAEKNNTLIWYYNGKLLNLNQNFATDQQNRTLKLLNLDSDVHTGNYFCKFNNSIGKQNPFYFDGNLI
jgi:hypothetical protein